MSFVIDFIHKLDIFGTKPTFFIRGSQQLTSIIGGLLTIVIYAATIVSIFYFAQELLYKDSPSVGTTKEVYNHPGKIQYFDEYFVMFSIDHDYEATIDESIYYPVGYIHKTTVNGGSSKTDKIQLEVVPCNKVVDSSYRYYELIRSKDLTNFYCINPNSPNVNKEDIYTNEFWGNDGFQMLQIKVFLCGYQNDASQCKSQDEIEKFLKSATVTFYTTTNFIDTTNHSEPFVNGLNEKFYYVNANDYLSATHYMRHIDVVSDDGLLFTSNNVNHFYTLDSMIEFTQVNAVEDGRFFTFSVQTTNTIETYHRSYMKLQDLAAEVGGVFSTLTMIAEIFLTFFSDSNYFECLIGSFFDIKKNYIGKVPNGRNNKSFIMPEEISPYALVTNLSNDKENDSPNILDDSGGNNQINSGRKSAKLLPTYNYGSYVKNQGNRNSCPIIQLNSGITGENLKANASNLANQTDNISNELYSEREKMNQFDKQNNAEKDGKKANNDYNTISSKELNMNNTKYNKTRSSLKKVTTNNTMSTVQKNSKNDEKIKLHFGFFDKLICIDLCESCYRKKKGANYIYYYKGKSYLEHFLEISTFMKHFYFQRMYLNLHFDKTQYKLFEQISRPILSEKYAGPFYNKKNIPEMIKHRLGTSEKNLNYGTSIRSRLNSENPFLNEISECDKDLNNSGKKNLELEGENDNKILKCVTFDHRKKIKSSKRNIINNSPFNEDKSNVNEKKIKPKLSESDLFNNNGSNISNLDMNEQKLIENKLNNKDNPNFTRLKKNNNNNFSTIDQNNISPKNTGKRLDKNSPNKNQINNNINNDNNEISGIGQNSKAQGNKPVSKNSRKFKMNINFNNHSNLLDNNNLNSQVTYGQYNNNIHNINATSQEKDETIDLKINKGNYKRNI